MPNLIDFMERATSGPIVSEDDFNIKYLIPNVRKTVREFNIHYTPEHPVPSDDGFADRLFEAAIEFVVRTGVYCDDT
ncbi:MAG: monomethylamine:corrinoid methyltransferase, partial [Anaerolineales bacterium]|nr:monomethylamine:corrinoid methyltransferase [Anaerolineales bacterium]